MKNKAQKAERESLDLKDKILSALKLSLPEVFAEGKINWERLKQALGEKLDIAGEKFTFNWAGKSGAIRNVLVPSKTTLRPAKKESVKFDESENLFIEGDNLEVLKLLQKAYYEKVKMIYIDPPYNTGNDFVYKDDFKSPIKNYLEQSGQVDNDGNHLSTNTQANGRYHSDWLTMMYPRLKLAWNLLRHDGVIFVSIDDNEEHHLRILMDEIFGEENFVAQIVWKKRTGSNDAKRFFASHDHEYLVVYAKTEKFAFSGIQKHFLSYSNPDNDPRGAWAKDNLTCNKTASERPNLYYPITDPKTGKSYECNPNRVWAYEKQRMERIIAENKVIFPKNGLGTPIYKRHLSEVRSERKPLSTWVKQSENGNGNGDDTSESLNMKFPLNFYATKQLRELLGGQYFDYPKSEKMIQELIRQASGEDAPDIILDFFAGSATTAQAVMAQNQEDEGNRKFILVQMPEPTDPNSEAYKAGYKTIADIGKERIRRVIKGYGDDPKPINAGFKVFKLDKSNYAENLFEYDPEKTAEENDKAFKKYLADAENLFRYDKINELDFVYENIIKEGLSLNAKISEMIVGKNKVYKAADGEREIFVSLDKKIDNATVSALKGKEYKEKLFVYFDAALDDSQKANLALNVSLKTI